MKRIKHFIYVRNYILVGAFIVMFLLYGNIAIFKHAIIYFIIFRIIYLYLNDVFGIFF